MNEEKKIEYARIFRALGDRHRIQILNLLMEKERNAGELLELVDVVQSTLSHHMKALCESGLVIPRKEQKWTYYTVSHETVEAAREFLKQYLEDRAIIELAGSGENVFASKQMEELATPVQEEEKETELTLYANMKSSKKKKAAKEKKSSDKKKGNNKKNKKDSDKKEQDKKKERKKESGKRKEMKNNGKNQRD